MRKKKGLTDKECNIKVGEKCELYKDGKHNCEEGLQCALYCDKANRGKCQYWCVKKLGAKCEGDTECIFEFCNKDNVCSEREPEGTTCERNEECFSFMCKEKVCAPTEKDPCLKKYEPKGCDLNPKKEGCPEFCRMNPSHISCKPPPQLCAEKPMTPGCPEYCKLVPNDEKCKGPPPPTPEECEEDRSRDGCPDFCKENKEHVWC